MIKKIKGKIPFYAITSDEVIHTSSEKGDEYYFPSTVFPKDEALIFPYYLFTELSEDMASQYVNGNMFTTDKESLKTFLIDEGILLKYWTEDEEERELAYDNVYLIKVKE